MTEEKAMENRARRALERRGLQLQKSRRRDPRAIDFGGYMIVDPATNSVVAGASHAPYQMTLDDVEAWLKD
jgi:hypothetical protein